MDKVTAVTASFTPMLALSVTIQGSGGGAVSTLPAGITCPGTCTAQFPTGTDLQLTANSDAASVFLSWGADGMSCAQQPTCNLTLNAALNVSAIFHSRGTTLWLDQLGSDANEVVSALAVDGSGGVLAGGTLSKSATLGPSEGSTTTVPGPSVFVGRL